VGVSSRLLHGRTIAAVLSWLRNRSRSGTSAALSALRGFRSVETECFEERDGQWKVIHEHSSVTTPADWDGKIHEGK
jgi:hypothetical protein